MIIIVVNYLFFDRANYSLCVGGIIWRGMIRRLEREPAEMVP